MGDFYGDEEVYQRLYDSALGRETCVQCGGLVDNPKYHHCYTCTVKDLRERYEACRRRLRSAAKRG